MIFIELLAFSSADILLFLLFRLFSEPAFHTFIFQGSILVSHTFLLYSHIFQVYLRYFLFHMLFNIDICFLLKRYSTYCVVIQFQEGFISVEYVSLRFIFLSPSVILHAVSFFCIFSLLLFHFHVFAVFWYKWLSFFFL